MDIGRFARSRVARLGFAGWIGLGVALACGARVPGPQPGHVDDAVSGHRGRTGRQGEPRDQRRDTGCRSRRPVARRCSGRLDGHAPRWRVPGQRRLRRTAPIRPRSRSTSRCRRAPTDGTQRITLEASSDGSTATLPVDIRVTPNAAGEVTLTTDFPELQGATDASFTLQPDAAQRHAGRPDVRRRRPRHHRAGPPTRRSRRRHRPRARSSRPDRPTSIKVDVQAPEDAAAADVPDHGRGDERRQDGPGRALGRDHRQLRARSSRHRTDASARTPRPDRRPT